MTPDDTNQPLTIGEIAQRIHLIRGKRVVLDSDLTACYSETTKRFNQQVNRNRERFSEDLMFQLSDEEFANLRLQFAASSLKGGGCGGRRYAPLVFTEHGPIGGRRDQAAWVFCSVFSALRAPPDIVLPAPYALKGARADDPDLPLGTSSPWLRLGRCPDSTQ